jgi:two-component system cell cycle response regulator DivK
MGMCVGRTVLLVEDFDDARFMMKLLLESSGYQVIEATNGQEAIKLASEIAPDLILMDLGLPVVDGLSATHFIRQNPQLKHVPIVALTAHTEREFRDRAYAAGCNSFIGKPVDFDQLESVLRMVPQAPAFH